MYMFAHLSFPVISYEIYARNTRRDAQRPGMHVLILALVGLAGLLPDILNVHVYLHERMNSYSHSLWPVPVVFLAAIMLVLVFKKLPRVLLFFLPYAYLSHLFLDCISGGIKPFYPLGPIIGDYYIPSSSWRSIDCVFIVVLFIIFGPYVYRLVTTIGKTSENLP
ncbi:MAG: metal-dependent hydrolase [Sedimentisphaerales bacterium]|nr:metal-dependent hydrolase [Sedimentisphaerales bacterium]